MLCVNNNERPLVSIIMGIYNCEDTLEDALKSIEKQTYDNWEIIMCDDGSTDCTLRVAEEFKKNNPEKVQVLKNPQNVGLNITLNKCLKYAKGKYIARQDGDDVSLPERLEKEVRILNEYSEFSIVSTDMDFFDEKGVWGKTNVIKKPQVKNFLSGTPFCHAPCMVRREALEEVQGYTESDRLLRVEDYHLWIKMYERGYRGINIQEPLYRMRDDRNAIKRRKFKYRLNESYVKAYAIKHLEFPMYCYIYCLKPLLLGLLPSPIYKVLHRIKQAI